jgi:hypothetical protein
MATVSGGVSKGDGISTRCHGKSSAAQHSPAQLGTGFAQPVLVPKSCHCPVSSIGRKQWWKKNHRRSQSKAIPGKSDPTNTKQFPVVDPPQVPVPLKSLHHLPMPLSGLQRKNKKKHSVLVTFSQEKYQLKLSHEKYLIFFISLSIVVG